jgi:hypothetical protein
MSADANSRAEGDAGRDDAAVRFRSDGERVTMGRRFRRHLGPCLRVGAYLGVLSLGLSCLWVARVAAEVEDVSLALGARLALELGDVVGEPQALTVNGQQVWIASKTTPLSVKEVLDRFDAHCVEASRALSTALDALEEQPPAAPELRTLAYDRLLIRRGELEGAGGQLVCLAATERLEGFEDLGRRLNTLLTTGALGALGELRYVRAQPRSEGGSHVVTVWSAGSFNLFEALPGDADVPGGDAERAPRPPDAVRTLSARVPGRGYAVYSYISRLSSAELSRFYHTEMPRLGWQPLAAEELVPETQEVAKEARAFLLGEAITYVVVNDTREAEGARASVTLVQAGALGAASATARAPSER